jgi:hypothetical protein
MTFNPEPAIGQTELERIVRDLQRDLLRLQTGDNTGWIAPTLLNSWVPYDGGAHSQPRYRRKNGVVYVQGLVKNGATSAVFFVLPEGFRPAAGKLLFASVTDSATPGRVDVEVNGNVIHQVGGTAFFSLCNIVFPADQ